MLTATRKKSRIIVIGSNFTGLTAASKLSKSHDVTVIDSKQSFQWTPNIHEILSDVKKESNLSVNLHTIVPRLGHHFIEQAVTSIDEKLQTVTLNNAQILPYDVLLIASGHTRANYDIKGASEYAYGFRSASDVNMISNAIKNSLNSGTKPVNINIVGGGFTGVEVLGELLRKYASNKRVHINVIESSKRLVQALPEKLSNDIVDQCKQHQVSFQFQEQITEVSASSITLGDKSIVESDVTIWSAGTKLPDYLDSINMPVINNGIAINAFLQTEKFANVFVAGDAATFSQPLAKQAGIAIDMGLHVGNNINRFCDAKSLKPFKVGPKPVLLSLGDINTYFIRGNLVLASPVLATAKEAVYQLYMARVSALLPVEQTILGIAGRITLSTEKLLLAEVLKARPRVLLGRSKVL